MRTLKSLLPALVIASLLSSLSYAAAPDRISGALTGVRPSPSEATCTTKRCHSTIRGLLTRPCG